MKSKKATTVLAGLCLTSFIQSNLYATSESEPQVKSVEIMVKSHDTSAQCIDMLKNWKVIDADLLQELTNLELNKILTFALSLYDGDGIWAVEANTRRNLEKEIIRRAGLAPGVFQDSIFMSHKGIELLSSWYSAKFPEIRKHKISYIWGSVSEGITKNSLKSGKQFFYIDHSSVSLGHIKILYVDHDLKIAFYFDSIDYTYAGSLNGNFKHKEMARRAKVFQKALGKGYKIITSNDFVQEDHYNCMIFSSEVMRIISADPDFSLKLLHLSRQFDDDVIALENLLPEFTCLFQTLPKLKQMDSWLQFVVKNKKLYASKSELRQAFLENFSTIAGDYESELDELYLLYKKEKSKRLSLSDLKRRSQLTKLIGDYDSDAATYIEVFEARFSAWVKLKEFSQCILPVLLTKEGEKFLSGNRISIFQQMVKSGHMSWIEADSASKLDKVRLSNGRVNQIRFKFLTELFRKVI